ncbi:TPA: aromatic acid/H+ symport family MFS transporter [Citrobacter amalonaticus]|uniref:MFS transporter n=1 Tax=Citrobacter TaxID=544 RepID=UPI0006BA0D06|nr:MULTISPECIES: aromatic acid/H+ symport family MFS transporter [Citrobacter]ELB4228906.1 aromatic acid/H+ symport family MFS transporter [Citrobacter amalonaticus]MBY5254359.1 aromatic acid/H+ symport family MFS transporter [Citrobacter amalonaticus]MDM3518933.1 aromatic acid/H+ symport family MFS transporter [Citrobacter sp. Ca225]MDM3525021.1 aromatic acid/H+ symport family MFS transporter [Citrobacter sp. Ca226]UYF55815.1 aromatic acid/H+ symport family MFS transporter [Citrobacter amalon
MTNKTTDIQAFINEHPFSKYQWMILVLCFVTVAMDGFDTAIIGFIASDLVQEWGVEKSALGPVMSAALVGLAVGALTAGPMADRIGRKKVLIMSILVFGGFSLLTAFASTLNQLTALRFLTGLGLGAAMPNAATLMSEYAPERRRALLVNLMFVGFPIGSSMGGFVSAWLIPHYGWQSVLILGGVMPLVLAVVLIVLLPESARYLVVKNKSQQQIGTILRRIAPLPEATHFVLRETGQIKEKSALGVIFSPRYALGTVMLCLTYFMGLLIFYLLTSWLPLLIRETGATLSQASIITALFPLGGGIGVLVLGALMDKFNPNKVVAVGWLLTGVFVCLVGFSTSSLVLMGVMVFIAGTIMNGAQSSMPALAAGFYPTQGRATGVAWMLGLGRFGGILGAFSGAFLMQAQLAFETIFTFLAIPALVSAFALMMKYWAGKRQLSGASTPTESPTHAAQKA